jgi:hypothetical protein
MTPGGFVFDIHWYVPSGFASLTEAGERECRPRERARSFLSSIRATLSTAGDRIAGQRVRGGNTQT